MSNVTLLANKSKDNRCWSVEQMLDDAKADIASGEETPTKALLIMVDTTNGKYNPSWGAANASATEQLAMIEVYKQILLRSMGV